MRPGTIAQSAYDRIGTLLDAERAKVASLERRVSLLGDLLALATARAERYQRERAMHEADTVLDTERKP